MEIKMVTENQQVDNASEMAHPTCMASVNRIAKLPVVESSFQTASQVYEKVKDFNGITKWGFETMEHTFHTVVETGKPYAIKVGKTFDVPIQKVDGVLCTGLDYVESKVPAMKLPPGEMYTTTKDYVQETVVPAAQHTYEAVHAAVDPAIQIAKHVVDPAVQAAKSMVDPAIQAARPTVEKAYKIVEPVVQPAVDKAQALKDYGIQKVEEFLHHEKHTEEDEDIECEDCHRSSENDHH